jgi:hypothetical protein
MLCIVLEIVVADKKGMCSDKDGKPTWHTNTAPSGSSTVCVVRNIGAFSLYTSPIYQKP